MNYLTVAELTIAHPEWRKAATVGDILTVDMVAVYTQRSPQYVLTAMRSGQLRAAQTGKHCMWRAAVADVQRWAMQVPRRRISS